MTAKADSQFNDNLLAPPSSRFALSLPDGLPNSAALPSTARPFALRFARPLRGSGAPCWPPHRYCHHRQVLVTDDAQAVPLVDSAPGWTPTTLVDKDGEGRRVEDWKPDMSISAES